ncbi:TPA: hypothetical protein N0F65_002913 [Lagenidium giganteum]|uniref:Uncharacterized protein n=1 Tax=Lagenidium giganteum TaxID=4803 RepID=A0AAV2Z8Q3_9STRA|nr:TPA: hypothetical protein N0F65_002913 [Lagenidium giganteum]
MVSTQVELHGQYSLERLRQFHDYRMNASWFRAFAVVLLTPLPVLALLSLTDAIPLQSPQKGFASSHTFWIRWWITAVVITAALLEQFRTTISTLPINNYHAAALTILTSTVWFKRVYPAYHFIFVHLSPTGQIAFAALLPIIKITIKNAFAHVMRNNDDLKAEAVILNVEVFNALFMVCCMQKASSVYSSLVMMSADFIHSCMSVWDLHIMLRRVPSGGRNGESLVRSAFWLDQAIFLCNEDPSLAGNKAASDQARLRKSGKFSLRRTYPTHVQSRGAHGPVGKQIVKPQSTQMTQQNSENEPNHSLLTGVLLKAPPPVRTSPLPSFDPGIQCAFADVTTLALPDKKRFVVQTLRVLYLLEFLLLTEFTETIVPIIYSVFVLMVLRLPNREYYSQFIVSANDDVVRQLYSVFSYSALELSSLVILLLVLRRYVRLSPMHLLAFVLERQARAVQSHIMLWFVYSFSLMLDHFGADFTFKFKWLPESDST